MQPAAVLEILVNAQTGMASGKLTKLNTQMKASEVQADRSSKAIGGTLAKGMKILGAAAAVGAAYGIYKAVDAGATFEKQMSQLGAVAQGSGRQMKTFEKQALKLGESTQYTANQVAEAQTELAKGGLSSKLINGGALKAALSLAAAGQLELALAAETTVNAMQLFGLKGKDAELVANGLAVAAMETTADVSDFAMAFTQGGAAVKAAGGNFNTATTILEALAKTGVEGSDAGTSMKTALIQLGKPSTKQLKLTEELNLQWFDQNGKLKTAAGLSEELRRATAGMTDQQILNTTSTLAGTDGYRTLLGLLEVGPAKLKAFERANEKQGTAQRVAAEQMDNLKGDWEQFTGALETAEIKLYKVLKGPLRATTQWLTGAVQAVSNFDFAHATEEVERFATKYETALTIAGTALAAFAAAWITFKASLAITAAIGAVTAAIEGMAAAFVGLDAAILANPIGLAAAAIVALGVAGYVAYQKIQPFREAVDQTVDALTPVASKAMEVGGAFLNASVGPLKVKEILLGIISPLALVALHFGAVRGATKDFAEWVGRAYRNVVGFVGSLIPFKVALLAVKLAIAPVVGLMMGLFRAAKILSPIVVAAANNFKSVWVAAMKVSLAIVQVLLKYIGNIGAVVGDVVGLVSNLLRGNWGGAWKNAKQLFVDVWHTILDLLKGGWTVIKTLFSSGTRAIGQILGSSTGALGKVASNIGDALRGAFSSAWEKIEGIFTTGANAVIDVINAVIEVINVIPGVPDIDEVGHIGGGGKGHHRQRKQTGGMIVPGSGSGDKFRTALPPGSFILNRKATAALSFATGGMMPVALEPGEQVFLPREVKAMGGARKLEAMNRKVPRFQTGGEVPSFGVGGIVEDAVNTVSPVAGKVAGKAIDALTNVAGKGAGYFIGKLPKPNLPEPFAALGPYIISEVTDYIKNGFKSKKLGSVSIAPGVTGYTGPPANMKQLGDNRYVDSHTLAVTALLDKMFGLTMSSGYRSPQHNAEIGGAPGSLHTHGSPSNPGATDSVGSMGAMQAYIGFARKHVAGLKEAMVDNYAGLGSNAHIGFFARGGLLQRLAEGGFVGSGYTVKGAAASGQQMHTAREIMEAADKTGASHLPRVASMMAATQESVMGATGNTFQLTGEFEGVSPSDRAYKQAVQWFTKGYYHGGGIGLSKKLSDPGDIAQEVEGSAYPDAYDPWKSEGQKWTDGWGKGAGGKDEEVKAVYHGARTGSLSFGPVPKSLPGIEKELRERRREVGQYRGAADRAGKEGKPKTQHAITVNITALETRIHELERARTKERQEAAKRKTTSRFKKALGVLTGFEPLIAAKERAFDEQQQFVEQLVALEPLAPELPESATNAQRSEAEKTYVSQFSTYVEAQERPAYQSLLGLAGDWRNKILEAEQKAAGPWQNAKTLGGLEGNWEDRIIAVSNEIDRISSLPKEHTAKYWKEHPKAYEHMQEQLGKLPMLRFTDSELRKVLGEGREKFFPGKARVRNPTPPFPGSGSFEDALSTVQGTHFPGMHEMLASLPGQRVAGMFGGAIWDVQTSLAELGLKVAGARSSLGSEGESETDESDRLALIEEQLRQANQRNLVFKRQKPIIDAYEASHPALSRFAGMYAKGGSIPAGMWGIAGERGPEPVVGPATVVSNPDGRSLFSGAKQPINLQLVVADGAVDVSKIKVLANGEAVKVSRKQGRGSRSIGARNVGKGMA